jgi:hypothetical protein
MRVLPGYLAKGGYLTRLILIIILVLIIVVILLRRKQPPPPLIEIQPPDGRDKGRPALRAEDESQDIEDLPSESDDSISEKEKDR